MKIDYYPFSLWNKVPTLGTFFCAFAKYHSFQRYSKISSIPTIYLFPLKNQIASFEAYNCFLWKKWFSKKRKFEKNFFRGWGNWFFFGEVNCFFWKKWILEKRKFEKNFFRGSGGVYDIYEIGGGERGLG